MKSNTPYSLLLCVVLGITSSEETKVGIINQSHHAFMEEKELCELMMEGLACLKEKVRGNTHILNSVRVAELERITRAQRMLSCLYSQMKTKKVARPRKAVKKVAKKKGTRRK